LKKLLLFCLVSISLSAQEQITWYGYHQPPASIFAGEDNNLGYVDLLLKQLQQQLPDYEHIRQKTTLGRVEQDMKLGKKVCFAALYNTKERQKFALFSQPFMMQPNLKVVLPRHIVDDLTLTDPVDLETLFRHYKLITAKVSSRAYGDTVDSIFHRYPHQVLPRVDSANLGLFKMLEMQRVDFIVSYPHETFYALQHINAKQDYASLHIKSLSKFNHGSIGCSRSLWGEQVIRHINHALERATKTSAYQQAMTSWLGPQAITPAYQKYYRQHISGTVHIE